MTANEHLDKETKWAVVYSKTALLTSERLARGGLRGIRGPRQKAVPINAALRLGMDVLYVFGRIQVAPLFERQKPEMNEPRSPVVSVITNVQNGAPYLREALDSLFAQDFDDWELIAWDDCSTDDSAEIIRSYNDPRVRYFLSPELTPLARARQLAVREARGEWVAFLDQDDIWTPHKLRLQFAVASADPNVGLLYGRTVSFNSSGDRWDFDHRHEFAPLPEGAIFERLFIDACFIAMSSTMFRRSALEKLGDIPSGIQLIPEYYMMIGVAEHYPARAVQEVICYYRWHANNMTLRFFKPIHYECLWLIDRWAACLSPRLVAHRRRVHQTVVAYEELHHRKTVVEGLKRLLRRGSLVYFLSRPFARGFRGMRRRIQRPYWLRTA